MEIVITARHATLTDRFRRQAEEKLEKIAQLAPRAQRVDVLVSHEQNPRQSSRAQRVELTVRDRGPVIRAEACAEDLYGALDLAQEKLLERLRRARDRRKVHHGRHAPVTVRTSPVIAEPVEEALEDDEPDFSPIEVREKVHAAKPMSLDDALYEMELVGHDFYLFVDSGTGLPSVVYRRRGWSYGVLRLDVSGVEVETGA
ncbi:MAG: ribosome hibernation-promoting factor, HPF/YfiA family [Actinomycetales bacterium]